MLPAGTRYDPRRHHDSAPSTPALSINAALVFRRTGRDGTPFCGCCDTALARPERKGRPPATCTACQVLRRRVTRARSARARYASKTATATEVAREAAREADGSMVQPPSQRAASVPTPAACSCLSPGDADVHRLVDARRLVDALLFALERTFAINGHGKRGSWQHDLVKASADLNEWLLELETAAPSSATSEQPTTTA